jgi:hypothetical protein
MSVPAKAAGSAVVLVAAILLLMVFGAPGAWGQVGPGAQRSGGDLVFVGKKAVIDSPVAGDVQALGSDVTINAKVEGRVVALGSQITLGRGGSIGGDLIAIGGNLSGVSREKVGGDIVAPASAGALVSGSGSDALVTMVSEPFSLAAVAIKLAFTLFWLLVSIPVVLLFGREVRASSLEARTSLLYAFLLGLVAFTSFVLTAVAFGYLVPWGIGVVLLALLGGFAFVAKVYGMVTVFHAVGVMLAGPRTHAEALAGGWLRGDLALTMIGAVTFGALRLVPMVGNVAWIVGSIVGLGVALATWFGRREPWFLADRGFDAGR